MRSLWNGLFSRKGKPLIAVTPTLDVKKDRLWLWQDYMRSVERAGGIGVTLPLTEQEEDLQQIAEQFDGFLFAGGPDLDPAFYGQEKMAQCGAVCLERDSMEMKLFQKALELDKPILGVCRGLQLINVALGGTLYQDIPAQIPSNVEHRVTQPPLERDTHEIQISEELPFGDLPRTLWVNSRHHQAVQNLAPGLKIRAVAPDGVVEAVYMPGKRHVRAVQWHPENFDNELSRIIFKDFVEAAR